MSKLLIDLLKINSVSGNESPMTDFLIDYIWKRKDHWKVQPEVYFGEDFHDCLLLKFGKPTGAVFSHIDTIGFSTRYENQLIPIGGPEIEQGTRLVGHDSLGPISCKIILNDDFAFHDFPRAIDRGTLLSFEQSITIDDEFIQAAYLDNRLGIYNCLKFKILKFLTHIFGKTRTQQQDFRIIIDWKAAFLNGYFGGELQII